MMWANIKKVYYSGARADRHGPWILDMHLRDYLVERIKMLLQWKQSVQEKIAIS